MKSVTFPTLICGLTAAALSSCSVQDAGRQPLYRQASAPTEARVADLLGRMTLDEKIGQLRCPMGWEMYEKTGGGEVRPSAAFRELMGGGAPVGSLWAVLRADPWTRKTLETGLNPRLAALALNALQSYAVEQTRLGIPLLFAEECPHGHMAIGTTVFPTGLALASSWDEDLARRVGEAVALEARAQGANIGYGPVLDVARDPRWSRMEETLGEDPVLVATLGTAMMRGMQGERQDDGRHLYSTLKHFAAYGVPEAGHNGARVSCGPRQLLAEYLPPFKAAVRQGVATIMTSYNSIDGVPCTANKWLLSDLLRGEWGFDGFVFSDLISIDGIAGMRVAADNKHAAAKSLAAGLDVDLGGNAFANLRAAVGEGLVEEAFVDSAVARVLRLKFKMGLFENPYVSPDEAARAVRSDGHRELARRAAGEGVVLLKNDGVLPLPKDVGRIAVIGPNADEAYNQLGDYTAPQDRRAISTLLDGVRAKVSERTVVSYVKGCAVRDTAQSDIAAAVRAARASDVVIVAVGGSSARDFKTEYIGTGAATVSEGGAALPDMDCGEGFDRSSLRLLGDQERLIRALAKTGKPLVVVYICGRAMDMNLAAAEASALLTAWYPGEQGGAGIADVIFGDRNPAGRLPVSIPRGEGQLPIYYSQETHRDYADGKGTPLFAFGYGLSYTSFDYSDLTIEEGGGPGVLRTVSLTVRNVGERDGDEVVQLYVADEVASVALPPMLLKAFRRVSLKRGESARVSFALTHDDLAIYDSEMNFVVEPGSFRVMVGVASDDIRLQDSFSIDN